MRSFYVISGYLHTCFLQRKRQLACGLVLLLLSPQIIWAEGSKEINSNGGDRAYLFSGQNADQRSFPFPTLGTMKVYVKAGETLYLGSSAQGMGSGTMNLRAPDGSVLTSGNSTTIGLIQNIAEETAGPKLSGSAVGYNPYKITATAAQEGVWEVDFIAPSITAETIPPPSPAASSWQQPSGPYIAAFDISVVSAANAIINGRVFTNVFCGQINSFVNGFNGIFHILTKDGYQYTLDNNGQAGNGFSFFANNKGFKTADGKASYKSVNNTAGNLVKDPTEPDTQSDITHKIFFNTPATDLPASAKTPGGRTTWLNSPVVLPTVDSAKFVGAEGTQGRAGTSPLGGTFNFSVAANGNYTLTIDANNNGSFADAADRRLTGVVVNGANSIVWDGLDGLGNKIPAGSTVYNASLSISLFNAEVHFPFFDVERNVNGIKLTRITGTGSPDNTVYWDDSDITQKSTPTDSITKSDPTVNLTGISSLVNGHKWGSPTPFDDNRGNGDFGNEKSIDTWAYAALPPVNINLSFTVSEADLEVVSLTPAVTDGCVGTDVSYTAVVRNNGPSDVKSAIFEFDYTAEFSNVKVTSVATTGTTTITTDTLDKKNAAYIATIDIPNGAVRTFNLTGKIAKASATGKIPVAATIMRPADVTDPDATNPDNAIPKDPFNECDSQPSGISCNNIKVDTATFAPSPDAGPDQTIDRDKVATLNANQNGAWAQVGNTPALATLSAATSAKTSVSNLSELGPYKFVFTNINGCTDTVTINVTSSKLDAPNVVTPNGDGNNDSLVIPDINLFPGSHLAIYNRWGNEVYHSDNYANDWDGKGLADGTYYYVFNRKETNGAFKLFKGWIYLKH